MSNAKITATPELLGAFGANDEAAVKAIAGQMKSTDIVTVTNTANDVHITLPFYSDLQSKAANMSDDELAAVSGGLDPNVLVTLPAAAAVTAVEEATGIIASVEATGNGGYTFHGSITGQAAGYEAPTAAPVQNSGSGK